MIVVFNVVNKLIQSNKSPKIKKKDCPFPVKRKFCLQNVFRLELKYQFLSWSPVFQLMLKFGPAILYKHMSQFNKISQCPDLWRSRERDEGGGLCSPLVGLSSFWRTLVPMHLPHWNGHLLSRDAEAIKNPKTIN